jgi:UDP-hydrolysing UDP-N-acetyl-D-glucosamine 2-epimerase
MKKIKLAVVTGSRADYGLLSYFLKDAKKYYDLNLIVTGAHINKNFGDTLEYIKNDKIKIFKKIDVEIRDGKGAVANSISTGIKKFNELFEKNYFDFVILLGDRYEIFSCAISAAIIRLPIIHIHGGEVTTNSYDEYFRHSISIFSQYHFVSAKKYYNRLVQLGNNPKNIFLVGGLGAANIRRIKFLNKLELKKKLGINFEHNNFFFIYHPETLEKNYGVDGLINSLEVLSELQNLNIFIFSTNADTQYKKFHKIINKFTNLNKNFKILSNLKHEEYLSFLKYMDGIIGNSSSGILEAPSLKVPTLNIGGRQDGRLRAKSIIDCGYNKVEIKKKIKKILKFKIKKNLFNNPYDHGDSINKIIQKIKFLKNNNTSKNKTFFDLNIENII